MNRRRTTAWCAGFVVLAVTACGGNAPGHAATDDSSRPAFDGPWAGDFAQAYDAATTERQREILADGVVSDAEYAQVREAFARCLADVGYTVTWTADGGFTLDVGSGAVDDEAVQDRVAACDSEHRGGVDYLYEQVARNPQSLDEAEIMAACLVGKGVVAVSFSADDYRLWFDGDDARLPYTVDDRAGEQAFGECNADPLGLFG